MITHLNGRLVEKDPSHAVIECAGVGYWVNITLNTYQQLSEDEQVKLYIHYIVREDAQLLYGFYQVAERTLFRHLISVNGIGSNTARVMLSTLSTAEIQDAILTQNLEALKSIKGIGLKSAQRIIIELKDKIGSVSAEQITLVGDKLIKNQAISALEVLGFQRKSIEQVVDKLLEEQPGVSLEALIKQTLKQV